LTYERKYPDLKVYIGAPVYKTVEPLQLKSLAPLMLNTRYGYFPQTGDALMERVRGIAATNFLRNTNADVFLSLDSDIVEFSPFAVDELVEQAVTHDIVAGIYLCKSVARTYPSSIFLDNTTIEFGDDPTPVEIQWAATGMLAIHRRVFEKMAEGMTLLHEKNGIGAFYPFFQTMQYDSDEGPIILSEDFAFCERARNLGFKIYANPSMRMGHMGQYVYRLEDMAATVFKRQDLTISRSGPHWRIELEGEVESPEDMGRLKAGERPEIEKRFESLSAAKTAS
jgi:hypothetical protein